jgi:hypothetical protein
MVSLAMARRCTVCTLRTTTSARVRIRAADHTQAGARRRREEPVAYRIFTTDDGREWQVWDVDPASGSSRLPGMLPGGWLCFETSGEKRRLHPVPQCWDGCSENELEAFRLLAVPVSPRLGAGFPPLQAHAP